MTLVKYQLFVCFCNFISILSDFKDTNLSYICNYLLFVLPISFFLLHYLPLGCSRLFIAKITYLELFSSRVLNSSRRDIQVRNGRSDNHYIMTNSRDVSEIVFTLMIIGDFIAMVFMFSVFFFTLNFILIKLKPSLVYGNGWKTEDVNMNLMARHAVLRVDMTHDPPNF